MNYRYEPKWWWLLLLLLLLWMMAERESSRPHRPTPTNRGNQSIEIFYRCVFFTGILFMACAKERDSLTDEMPPRWIDCCCCCCCWSWSFVVVCCDCACVCGRVVVHPPTRRAWLARSPRCAVAFYYLTPPFLHGQPPANSFVVRVYETKRCHLCFSIGDFLLRCCVFFVPLCSFHQRQP